MTTEQDLKTAREKLDNAAKVVAELEIKLHFEGSLKTPVEMYMVYKHDSGYIYDILGVFESAFTASSFISAQPSAERQRLTKKPVKVYLESTIAKVAQ